MRLLVATTANDGHFGPLVPFARACVATGHEVRVAAPASFARTVAAAGFVHEPFADPDRAVVAAVMSRLPTMSVEDADTTVIRDVFGRIDAQAALPALAETLKRWRPDLVLREPAESASLAAAERAGVPHAQVAIGMQEFTRRFAEITVEPMAELGGLVGLPADRLSRAAAGAPTLTTVPEALDRAGDACYDGELAVSRFGDEAAVPEPGSTPALPPWGDPDVPLVYVTFGSVTGSLPSFAGVFRDALDALADLPIRVLMTVGRRVDVAGLGPVPGNAHVEPWWPQADALAQASAVVSHGGFGTTMGTAATGLPQAVAPIFTSDQAINSRHLAATGAGVAVEPGPDAVSRACTSVVGMLTDASYATRARGLAGEFAALPPPAAAVPLLERLARG